MRPDPELERLARAMDVLMTQFKARRGVDPGSAYARLNVVDLEVIGFLYQAPEPEMMRQVADRLEAPMSTATTIVDRLVKQGLIERSNDHEDRRIVRVGLTAQGRQLASHMRAEQLSGLDRMRGLLNESERSSFIVMIEKIAAGLSTVSGADSR
jgi:DNA-binding MarR family transcriptional regulator